MRTLTTDNRAIVTRDFTHRAASVKQLTADSARIALIIPGPARNEVNALDANVHSIVNLVRKLGAASRTCELNVIKASKTVLSKMF